MQVEDFQFLLSPVGQKHLLALGNTPIVGDNHLRIADQLRRQVGSRQAQAILETTLLRQKAAGKFSRAADMYFTRDALEQASGEIVSTYRVKRFDAAGFKQLADLGCGIGGDSITLAADASVTGVDWDPVRLLAAQENVRIYGHAGRFTPLLTDLLALTPLNVDALFADPGRRDERGRRIYSVYNYRPPLSFLERWRELVPHQAVKISPGVDYAELPSDVEVEFISVKGQVREAVLWSGDLRTDARRRATLLPSGITLIDEPVEEIDVTRPKSYLYEPDGAVIRAHLVEQLAIQLGAEKIDADIAYLTADQYRQTLFARCYVVEDVLPFQLKRLRQYLRQRGIGHVTIKKRGSPLDPDVLRKRLRLSGDGHCIVFLTRVKREPTVLICRMNTSAEQA